VIVFNDPRRFGVLDISKKSEMDGSRWFKHLGIEPLTKDFSGEWFFENSRKLKGPIKGFLMDQRRVVGVGNIYASEALFAAGIKPTRAAGKIAKLDAESLVKHIRRILSEAIQAGGSTIRDYKNSKGENGSFQQRFFVYGRKGKPCLKCKTPIRAQVIAGRNTFWCPKCQR
jgi:formamidopyrimidine-DNA glycosylase